MSYKFLEHTADVKFLATGKSIEEMFESAAKALFESIKGDLKIEQKEEIILSVDGEDEESLLHNFLEEFLFLLDAKGFIASRVEEIKIDLNSMELKAKVIGDNVLNYNFTNEVKAITFNEMFVRKTSNKWECQVVLDV